MKTFKMNIGKKIYLISNKIDFFGGKNIISKDNKGNLLNGYERYVIEKCLKN